MNKVITKSATFSALTLGLISVVNQVAVAAAKCTLNGREVPCGEFGGPIKVILGWGIGIFLIFLVIFALVIWVMVFWVMMIVHATQHDVANKAMWIILMVFTGIVGALVYYFAVKREFDKQSLPPAPTITR